jgi:biopolymer transport protein ExbB/TolQ
MPPATGVQATTTAIEKLQARVAAYEKQVADAEPFVPNRLKAKAQAARENLEHAEDDARVNVKELYARYAKQYDAVEKAQEAKLKTSALFVKITEEENEVREQLRATVRLLHAAGEIAPHLGHLHTRPDFESRKAVQAFHGAANRPF